MTEQELVDRMVEYYKSRFFVKHIAAEVACLHRSADIAIITKRGYVWVIECKLTNISKAIEQLKTHRLAADYCFIGMPFRNTKQSTVDKLEKSGFGLLYLHPDTGFVLHDIGPKRNNVHGLTRKLLMNRIIERVL